MRIESKSVEELTSQEVQAWVAMTDAPGFSSPFLHYEYAKVMSEFRPQVEVAVLMDGDEIVGFLPYERHNRKIARPLGIRLADFQGVISRPGLQINPKDLLDNLHLHQLHFDHLIIDQQLAHHRFQSEPSPFIDVSHGFDSYLREQQSYGHRSLKETLRKERKLRREVGEIEFRWHDDDDFAFEMLLQWKSAQRELTQTANILEFPWVCEFLKKLCSRREGRIQGALSTIRVRDEIVAVHMGIHSNSTLHYWFPTYNIEFSPYSPGLIMVLELARHSARKGIHRIDLGKGEDPYKWSFANGSIDVASVAIDHFPLRRVLRNASYRVKHWAKKLPLLKALKTPKRLIREWQNQSTMEAS